MKILFSFLLLILFSVFSFSQQVKDETKPTLVAGKGWGIIALKNTRKIIEAELGEGISKSRYDDVYFVDYPEKGLQISYTSKKDEAYTIFFYNHQKRYENFVTPAVATDKGITWTSQPDDVLKAYGKPANDFKDDSGNNAWRRLEYAGIDFLFELGELKRIGIHTQ